MANPFINTGTDVGLQYEGAAPDLGWKESATLTMPDPPSTNPVISSPTANQQGVSTLPTIEYSASTNATSYDIQIATDSNFATVVVDINTGSSGTSYTLSGESGEEALDNNVEYYVRVRGSNTHGVSGWSASVRFWVETESGEVEYHIDGQKPLSVTVESNTDFTFTKPDNLAVGDLVVIVFGSHQLITQAQLTVVPDGFTLIRREGNTGASGNPTTFSYIKVAGAGEPAGYTFQQNTGSRNIVGVCGRVSGFNQGDIQAGDSGTNSSDSTVTSLSIPSITLSNENTLVISMAASVGARDYTFAAGVTALIGNTDYGDAGMEYVASSGAMGTRDVTIPTASRMTAQMFGINSDAGGAATAPDKVVLTSPIDTEMDVSILPEFSG
jgi:hypothetical protein